MSRMSPAARPLDPAELAAEAAACRAMWCALVDRLLLDAAQSNRDGERAREWLRCPDQAVLDYCGLDRGAFVAATRELAGRVVEKPRKKGGPLCVGTDPNASSTSLARHSEELN